MTVAAHLCFYRSMMTWMRSAGGAAVALALASTCGCRSVRSGPDAGSSVDGGGGATNGATVYSRLNDPSKWSFYTVVNSDPSAPTYVGGAFDGRYAYFAPFITAGGVNLSVAARYDTTASFAKGSSWSSYDISAVNSNATNFQGAAFDGRYVYWVSSLTDHQIVARYDTKSTFAKPASWTTYTLPSNGTSSQAISGAEFDGRYVYVLSGGASGLGSSISRYDTTQSFTVASSWTTFDVSAVDPLLKSASGTAHGFGGAVFDGRYLDVVPGGDSDGHNRAVRYDTKAPFTSTSAWAKFDLTANVSSAIGQQHPFSGGIFDGRYVYFVPNSSLAVRYDTQASFTTAASWNVFDTTTVAASAKTFINGAFDGRYIYFAPAALQGNHALVIRHDTRGGFTSSASWSSFDLTAEYTYAFTGGSPATIGFSGAVFDGRYLYLMPLSLSGGNGVSSSSVFARFDAKQPAALPPNYAHGLASRPSGALEPTHQTGHTQGLLSAFEGRLLLKALTAYFWRC